MSVSDSAQWQPWDHFLTGQDRAVFEACGRHPLPPLPNRPALIVIDVTWDICGPEGASAIEAVRASRWACGPRAWAAVPLIQRLLEAARKTKAPVVHTRPNAARLARLDMGAERAPDQAAAGNAFVPQLDPKFNETVIGKSMPSAFWGTGLADHLDALGADGVILAGATTSGCVRATALDAHSQERAVVMVPDAVFDRFEASHAITLFDCQAKYAELLDISAAEALFDGWARGGPR